MKSNQTQSFQEIAKPSDNDLGLYLHLPFCDHICGYCDFYTVYRQPNHPIVTRFVEALVEEIRLRSETQWGGKQIKSIYLGGGTPSLIQSSKICQILDSIRSNFESNLVREISIEINPCLIDGEALSKYFEAGITRPSFGIQSFQNSVLKNADRVHNSAQAVNAINLAHEAGFSSINVDLMYGIPGQKKSDWKYSLKKALELDVQHVSLYNLTYEEGTPFFRQRASGTLTPVTEDLEEWFYRHAVDFMQENGFLRYEISNFARPGFECKHNLNYWNRGQYLGLGPSAHSFDGMKRYWNGRNLRKYLEALEDGILPPMELEYLDESMRLEEWVFLNLRQTTGFRIAQLRDEFGVEIQDWPNGLRRHLGDDWRKWLSYDGDSIALTRDGFWVSNSLFPIFCSWFQNLMSFQPAESEPG